MKFVEDGYLYDTDNAECLGFHDNDMFELYRTKSGKFFYSSVMSSDAWGNDGYAVTDPVALEKLRYIVSGESVNSHETKERAIQRMQELFPDSVEVGMLPES